MPAVEAKYLALSDYNKSTIKILDTKVKEKPLVDISDISVFTDNSDLNKKVGTWVTKAELKREWDKTAKLQAIYSS